MDIAGALIFVGDALGRIAGSSLSQICVAVFTGVVAASFLLGRQGAMLRAGLLKLSGLLLIGCLGLITILSVKGVPPPEAPVATAPKQPGAARHDPRQASAAKETPKARPEGGRIDRAEAPRWIRDLAAARRTHMNVREEIARTPEAERSSEQRRQDAAALHGLARIDRDEGRVFDALKGFNAARAALAKLADPEAKRAAVGAALDAADMLATDRDPAAARAAYREAIADRRSLVDEPEHDRRLGVAETLMRYAGFEIGQRQDAPARAAIDEAASHYAFLRDKRGAFDVLRRRAELAIATGDYEAARRSLGAMRPLLADSALAAASPGFDVIEARLALDEGRAADAEAMFARAATAYRRIGDDFEARRALAAALLGHAEAGFAARNIAAARERAAESIALRQALGERARVVRAWAVSAFWEAAMGDIAAAREALARAVAAQRETGETRFDQETEATIHLLCMGVLHGDEACGPLAPNATSSGP